MAIVMSYAMSDIHALHAPAVVAVELLSYSGESNSTTYTMSTAIAVMCRSAETVMYAMLMANIKSVPFTISYHAAYALNPMIMSATIHSPSNATTIRVPSTAIHRMRRTRSSAVPAVFVLPAGGVAHYDAWRCKNQFVCNSDAHTLNSKQHAKTRNRTATRRAYCAYRGGTAGGT